MAKEKICDCGSSDDVISVQFRDGWGASANGYWQEIHLICRGCRNEYSGAWRYAHDSERLERKNKAARERRRKKKDGTFKKLRPNPGGVRFF